MTKHGSLFVYRDIERDFLTPQCKKIEEWLTKNKSDTLVLECQGGKGNNRHLPDDSGLERHLVTRGVLVLAFFQHLLYQEIRKKFIKLGCEVQLQGKV
jgi:hypothetical protein